MGGIGSGRVVGCGAVLLAVTLIVWRLRRAEAWVGWLWYLGTLVPVIGLVQVGKQATADRYAYFPLLGVYSAASFLSADWLRRVDRKLLWGASIAMLVALGVATHRQSKYWVSSETLFRRAVEVEPNNPVAAYLLGMALAEKKDPAAEPWLRRAVEAGPADVQARMALGQHLMDRGSTAAAVVELDRAVELAPHFAEPYLRRGIAYAKGGDYRRALVDFDRAAELDPAGADPWFNQGLAQLALGKPGLAALAFEEAVKRDGRHRFAWLQLGLVRLQMGDAKLGVTVLRRAAGVQPRSIEAVNTLAWVLATHPDDKIRDGGQAVEWIEPIVRSTAPDPSLLDTLAAAYACAGRRDDAVNTAREAMQLARSRGDDRLAEKILQRITLYSAGQSFRDPSLAPVHRRELDAP
jgi:Flp pilus assembly protein TadD